MAKDNKSHPAHILSTRMTYFVGKYLSKTSGSGLMEWGSDNHIRVYEAEWGTDNIGALVYDWELNTVKEVKQHFYGVMEIQADDIKIYVTFRQTITSARFGSGPELMWLRHFRQNGIKTRGGHKFYIFLVFFAGLILLMLLATLFHNA